MDVLDSLIAHHMGGVGYPLPPAYNPQLIKNYQQVTISSFIFVGSRVSDYSISTLSVTVFARVTATHKEIPVRAGSYRDVFMDKKSTPSGVPFALLFCFGIIVLISFAK